jgi:hypothetical protein
MNSRNWKMIGGLLGATILACCGVGCPFVGGDSKASSVPNLFGGVAANPGGFGIVLIRGDGSSIFPDKKCVGKTWPPPRGGRLP